MQVQPLFCGVYVTISRYFRGRRIGVAVSILYKSGEGAIATFTHRQEELLQLVETKGQMSVDELARHLGVSGDTVRRDLQHLERRNVLLRTHGGAVSTSLLAHRETPFLTRVFAHADAKTRIGRAATQLISDGETLIVNGGSTTFAFAANLGVRRNLKVVTPMFGLRKILWVKTTIPRSLPRRNIGSILRTMWRFAFAEFPRPIPVWPAVLSPTIWLEGTGRAKSWRPQAFHPPPAASIKQIGAGYGQQKGTREGLIHAARTHLFVIFADYRRILGIEMPF